MSELFFSSVRTALMLAAIDNQVEAVSALLLAGSDADIEDKKSKCRKYHISFCQNYGKEVRWSLIFLLYHDAEMKVKEKR